MMRRKEAEKEEVKEKGNQGRRRKGGKEEEKVKGGREEG